MALIGYSGSHNIATYIQQDCRTTGSPPTSSTLTDLTEADQIGKGRDHVKTDYQPYKKYISGKSTML